MQHYIQRQFLGRVETCLKPAFSTTEGYFLQPDEVLELQHLCLDARKNIYTSDADIYGGSAPTDEEQSQQDDVHSTYESGGPSTFQSVMDIEGCSTQHTYTPDLPPAIVDLPEVPELRGRPVRAPQTYTPGSDALPHKRRRGRK